MDTMPLLNEFKTEAVAAVKPEAEPEEQAPPPPPPRFEDVFPLQQCGGGETAFNHAFRYDARAYVLCVVASKSFVVKIAEHVSVTPLGWHDAFVAASVKVGVDDGVSLRVCSSADQRRTMVDGAETVFEGGRYRFVRIATTTTTIDVVPRNGWSEEQLKERLVDLLFPSP